VIYAIAVWTLVEDPTLKGHLIWAPFGFLMGLQARRA